MNISIKKSWRGVLAIAVVVFAFLLVGACQCGAPPPNESTPETTQTDGKKNPDGGHKDFTPEIRPRDITHQCSHRCDCKQGEDCQGRACVKSPGLEPIYCCTNPGCVSGKKCEEPNGQQGTCPTTNTCKQDIDCGTPTCTQSGGSCLQNKPICLNGSCTTQPIPSVNATCENTTGRCISKGTECKNHCDCAQGQYCEKGQCTVGPNPVYCCDKVGCPAKAQCFKTDGGVGNCSSPKCTNNKECGKPTCTQQGSTCYEYAPTCESDGTCNNQVKKISGNCQTATGICNPIAACRTHCDCDQGFTCVQGTCAPLSSRQTFCCDKAGCPDGKACFKTDGSPNVCGQTKACKTDAECGGKSCRDLGSDDCIEQINECDQSTNRCVIKTQSINGARCSASGGSCIITPPPTCKVHCDCPQGQGCFQGKCALGPGGTPTYCCDKAGCKANEACQYKDGRLGKCPGGPQCTNDVDCGKSSCNIAIGGDCLEITPSCDLSTRTCTSTSRAVKDATCTNGRCVAKQATCQTSHCDCPQGQYCYQGLCYKSTYPYYCCSNKGCPAGNQCISQQGQIDFCPTACISPCDCPEGQACVSGKCAQQATPAYCCDKPQSCPSGAACKNKTNQSGTCPVAPRTCSSPCDCVQGEGCVAGKCTKGATPVYCCEKSACPAGKACINKRGLNGTCAKSCKVSCDCDQGDYCLAGSCQSDPLIGKRYCCNKPGCPLGQFCTDTQGQYQRCPTSRCTTACDCSQGEDCRGGACVPVSPPVYCCSKAKCPSGDSCKDTAGKWSTCPNTTTCKSPCDCPQGEDCYKGQCVQLFPQVYCCSKAGCPGGQACFDQANKANFCPGAVCKTACDCPIQGQSCVRNTCVYLQGSARVYCCDKQYCPAGNRCEDKQGNLKTCSQTSCKTPCDCNQGEDCRNGQCILVQPAVYCCSGFGCPQNQACTRANGTQSVCGSP